MVLVRYADDFVMDFKHREEAELLTYLLNKETSKNAK